jgi:hypothetical protein
MRVVTAPAPTAARLAARGARPAGQPEKPAAELLSITGFAGGFAATTRPAPDQAGGGRPTRSNPSQICRVDLPPGLRKVC